MTNTLAELGKTIELCEKADSRGKWFVSQACVSGRVVATSMGAIDCSWDKQADHIAHANPTYVKALAEALTLAVGWMSANVPHMECNAPDECDHCEGEAALTAIQRKLGEAVE